MTFIEVQPPSSVGRTFCPSTFLLFPLSCLLLITDPLRVLGGDQRLDPLGEYGLGAGIVGIFVGPGLGLPEELLVLQTLGGGAVARPVLLELVEPLHRLKNDDDHAEDTRDPCIAQKSCGERYEGGGDDLGGLEPLEASLVPSALAAVPSLLIIQPVQDLFF